MKLFSGDELVLFGPGSEWFWSALSGIVTAVTLLAIYRQLRLQASQAAIAQLDAFEVEWASERMTRYKLALAIAHRDLADPGEVPSSAGDYVGTFLTKVAAEAQRGHINAKLLWDHSGGRYEMYWALLEPYTQRMRVLLQDQGLFEPIPWLIAYGEARERKAGQRRTFDAPLLAEVRDAAIVSYLEELQVEQSLRTVMIEPAGGAARARRRKASAVSPVASEG